jgi:hypothetical protein
VAFKRGPAASIEARTDSEPIHPSAPVDFKAEFIDLNMPGQQSSVSSATSISALKLKWKKPLYNANLVVKYRLYYQHLHHGPILGFDLKNSGEDGNTFHPHDVDDNTLSHDENDIIENSEYASSQSGEYGYLDMSSVEIQNKITNNEKYIDIDLLSDSELTDNYYEFLLEDLMKYSTYKFKLVALDSETLSKLNTVVESSEISNSTKSDTAFEFTSAAEIVVETPSDVPDGPPEALRVDTLNTTSIIVSWQQPLLEKRNGLIIGYKISIKENEKQIWHSNVDSDPRSKIISGLQPGSKYSVRITARTINGSGPASDWIIAETFSHEMDGKFRGYQNCVLL